MEFAAPGDKKNEEEEKGKKCGNPNNLSLNDVVLGGCWLRVSHAWARLKFRPFSAQQLPWLAHKILKPKNSVHSPKFSIE